MRGSFLPACFQALHGQPRAVPRRWGRCRRSGSGRRAALRRRPAPWPLGLTSSFFFLVALSGLTLQRRPPTWAAPIVRASTDRALNPPWGSTEIGVAGFAVSAAAGRPGTGDRGEGQSQHGDTGRGARGDGGHGIPLELAADRLLTVRSVDWLAHVIKSRHSVPTFRKYCSDGCGRVILPSRSVRIISVRVSVQSAVPRDQRPRPADLGGLRRSRTLTPTEDRWLVEPELGPKTPVRVARAGELIVLDETSAQGPRRSSKPPRVALRTGALLFSGPTAPARGSATPVARQKTKWRRPMARPDKAAAVAELTEKFSSSQRRCADRVPRTHREGAEGTAPLTR